MLAPPLSPPPPCCIAVCTCTVCARPPAGVPCRPSPSASPPGARGGTSGRVGAAGDVPRAGARARFITPWPADGLLPCDAPRPLCLHLLCDACAVSRTPANHAAPWPLTQRCAEPSPALRTPRLGAIPVSPPLSSRDSAAASKPALASLGVRDGPQPNMPGRTPSPASLRMHPLPPDHDVKLCTARASCYIRAFLLRKRNCTSPTRRLQCPSAPQKAFR